MYCIGQDVNITGQSIDEIIEQLDSIEGAWKIRKALDGFYGEKWFPVKYAVKIWSKLRRCHVFENELFFWSWNVPAPDPSNVLAITNTHGLWCESAIENQKMCSERAGYAYERFFLASPPGTSANWSKFVALEAALDKALKSNKEQVIWLDGDILFERQINFGDLFPTCDVCCGWYFPTEFYKAELHTDGIANGCMFSLAVNTNMLERIKEICRLAPRNQYCQSYPFDEIALKELYLSSKNTFRFDHISTTPHSMWRQRENYTGIHHCVSGMASSRHKAMEDTHRAYLCDL